MAWQVNKLELTKSALTGCLAENEQNVNWSSSPHGMHGLALHHVLAALTARRHGSTGHFRDRCGGVTFTLWAV